MKATTKILMVEHDQNDIDLIQRELSKGKIAYTAQVVQTEKEYESALRTFEPDLILCDYTLPSFNGPEAFRIKEEMAPHTPFIYVSGTIGEENSIELIKKGATDFALKEKLYSLVLKVKRALKEAKDKKERVASRKALIESEARLNEAQALARVGSWEIDLTTGLQRWSNELYNIFGIEKVQASQDLFISFIHPEDRGYAISVMQKAYEALATSTFDFRFIRKDGALRYALAEWKCQLNKEGNPIRLYGIVQDITDKKIARQELEETHNKLQFHLENTPLGFIEWNDKGDVQSWSKHAEEIFGWTEKEFIEKQKSGYSKIYKDDLPWVSKLREQLYSGEVERNSVQHRCNTKDGRVIWCEWFNSAIKDKNGKVEAVMSLVQDITERKNAENVINNLNVNLQAANHQQASILNTLPANIALLDEAGKIIAVNEAWNQFADSNGLQSPNHGIGASYIAIAGKATGTDEDTGHAMAEGLDKILKGHLKEFALEYPCHSPLEERWFRAEVRPLSEGKHSGAVVMHLNITERKIAEALLIKSESQLKNAQSIARVGSWEADATTNEVILSVEGQKIMGLSSGESHLSMDAWLALVHPLDRDNVIQNLEMMKSSLADTSYQCRVILKDGVVKHLQAESKFTFDANHIPTGMYGTIQDITAQKIVEAEIKSLNENLEQRVKERTIELTDANIALEAFSYSVSHDLRSPVRSLVGFTQIINKEYSHGFNADLKELFGYIESSGKRMTQLIDDLLVLAKSGKEPLNIGEVDLKRLFTKVWDNLLVETPHHATIEIHDMPVVKADGSMLQQAIVNLISNAIKYSSKKDKPHIEVSCIEAADKVTICVKDNGAGFDMKNYDRLFGAFQRLHGTSEFEGTGIGLTLIKRIIERHGGEVWGEGEVDKGATFCFTLPMKEESMGQARVAT